MVKLGYLGAARASTKGGIHLGEMMKSLTTKLGGEGGGHDGAAGWSGKSDRVAAESSFINLLANQRGLNMNPEEIILAFDNGEKLEQCLRKWVGRAG